MFYFIAKLIVRLFSWLYFRLNSQGKENVPRTGSLLLVSNHNSYLDPVVVGCETPRPLHYMARAELFRIPVFNWLIKGLNAIPISRDILDRYALNKAITLLRQNKALLLFPEGTRSQDGQLQPFKPGVAMIADKVPGLKIVPVFIKGSFDAMPRGVLLPRPRKIQVFFGPAFSINSNPASSISQKQRYLQLARLIFTRVKNLYEHGLSSTISEDSIHARQKEK